MASKRLGSGVGTVWVHAQKGGDMVSFTEGDDIPAWAAKQMGDHCFQDSDVDPTPAPEPMPAPVVAPTKPAAPVLTSPEEGAALGSNTVSVEGLVEQDGTIVLYDGDSAIGTGVSADGSFTIVTSLANGEHLLTACVTVDGVKSDWSEAVTVTVDAPAA